MGGVRGVGVQVAEVVHGVLEGERLQAALLAEGGVDGPPHLWRALGQVVPLLQGFRLGGDRLWLRLRLRLRLVVVVVVVMELVEVVGRRRRGMGGADGGLGAHAA